jgi:hypothetical protein
MNFEPHALVLFGLFLVVVGGFVDGVARKAMPPVTVWHKPTVGQRAAFFVVGTIALVLGISRLLFK